jgi:endonuclease-3
MKRELIHPILAILKKEVTSLAIPVVGKIAEETKDPYRVLISCILSLRTRDEVTAAASKRLFQLVESPCKMVTVRLGQNDILVPYGQFICRPILPFCSRCKINSYCDKVNVIRSR